MSFGRNTFGKLESAVAMHQVPTSSDGLSETMALRTGRDTAISLCLTKSSACETASASQSHSSNEMYALNKANLLLKQAYEAVLLARAMQTRSLQPTTANQTTLSSNSVDVTGQGCEAASV